MGSPGEKPVRSGSHCLDYPSLDHGSRLRILLPNKEKTAPLEPFINFCMIGGAQFSVV